MITLFFCCLTAFRNNNYGLEFLLSQYLSGRDGGPASLLGLCGDCDLC